MTAIEAALHALRVAFLAVQDEPPAEEGPLAGLARALWVVMRWVFLAGVVSVIAVGLVVFIGMAVTRAIRSRRGR